MLEIRLTPPSHFIPDETLEPPALSASPQIHLLSWQAWRTTDNKGELVSGCFELPTTTWAPDADALALGKLQETIAGTAVRAVKFGDLAVTGQRLLRPGTERTLAGHGEVTLDARATQGFVLDTRGHVLVSCFALCGDANEPSRCAEAVHDARLPSTFVAPPEPSLALRAVLLLVHHPNQTAAGLLTLTLLAGAAAIATRKRPKRRR